jgi:hypothetical protein
MPIPAPIDLIHYSEPRAVQVREPENLSEIHSAIHGSFNVYVDTVLERKAVLDNWSVLMEAVAVKVREIIDAEGNGT